MATVTNESLKQELAELWDISVNDIFEKVLDVKRVIGDVSDSIVLGYLKRCDLNIERAINYHFSRSLSPTPTGPEPANTEPQQNNDNHNYTFDDAEDGNNQISNAHCVNADVSMNVKNEFKMNDVVLVYSNDRKLLKKGIITSIKRAIFDSENSALYNIRYDVSNYTELVGVDRIIENTASNIAEMRALNTQSPSSSPMAVDESKEDKKPNDNDSNGNKKRRRSMRNVNKNVTYKYKSFKLSDEEDEKSESDHFDFDFDSDLYDPSSNSNKNKKKKRKVKKRKKRKRSQSQTEEPKVKKRKIDSNVLLNTNTNSSMKQELNSSDDDDDTGNDKKQSSENVIPSLPKDALEWKQYTLGVIKLRFYVNPETHLNSVGDLWWQLGSNVLIEFDYLFKENEHWFTDFDAFKSFMNEIFNHEMRSCHESYFKMEMKNIKLIKQSNKAKKYTFTYAHVDKTEEEIAIDALPNFADDVFWPDLVNEGEQKQEQKKKKCEKQKKKVSKEKEIVMPFKKNDDNQRSCAFDVWNLGDIDIKYTSSGLYECELFVHLTREIQSRTHFQTFSLGHAHSLRNEFDLSMIKTMSFVTNNKQLLDDYMDTFRLIDDYKNKGHKFTLVSLLDYSVKYAVNADKLQRSINDQSKYGVNLKLFPYQIQSIEYMVAEEQHCIGFYRHFYTLGRFYHDHDKNAFFYVSKTFDKIIVNKLLPIAHGGFLCEEMGLGKTVEMLSLINCCPRRDINMFSDDASFEIGCKEMMSSNKNGNVTNEEWVYYKSKATLIIAPVSLVGQWEKETEERNIQQLDFNRYYGSNRKRDISKYIDKDIVFTTYGILGKENGTNRKKHILHCIEWHRIILDEGHYIKNEKNVSAKNINKLKGINKWILTGTPFGTKLYDIKNQLKFIGMRDEHLAAMDIKGGIAKIFNPKARGWKDETQCLPLLKIMKSMVMRHKKEQKFNNVQIVSLPEKKENVILIEFTPQQKEYYEKLYATAKERYLIYKSTGNIGRGTIQILSSLHPARQACSGHIYSADEIEEELSKAQTRTYRVQEMVNDRRNKNKSAQELFELAHFEAFNVSDSECPICYETPFDDPLQTPCRHIFCGECIKAILNEKPQCPMCRKQCTIKGLRKPPKEKCGDDGEGDKKEQKVEEKVCKKEEKKMKNVGENNEKKMIRFDSKLKRLFVELERLKNDRPNDKSLIFTSFSKSLSWICDELESKGFKYKTLTGSMTMNKRKKALDEFANDKRTKIFVLTVRSGAVGITLTSANHIFMMEPQFNPALYRQAINRVYRLGQKKRVYIHTLIMKGSIEERIWNINKDKYKETDTSKSTNAAGSINSDKNAKLQMAEISKLFE